MPTISEVSSATGANAYLNGNTGSTAARLPQKTLGQNDFLKLLATQFQKQDPMKPMEDTAFIAQMAQFSALEQTSATVTELTALRAEQSRLTANSYLGHRVTVTNTDGATVTGDVSAVERRGTEPMLVVGGESYPLSAVLRVEPGVVTSPQPVPSGGA